MKLSQLGKPNSASRKAVKQYLDELFALEKEIDQASKQFADAIARSSLSKDDRLTYALSTVPLAQAFGKFGLAAKDFE